MTDTTTTEIEALSVGLIGVDASRRVGWAKAFDALRRVDGLEEELRQTRDELKWLRRAYSRLLGFVENVPVRESDVFRDEMAAHRAAEQSFRHDDAWDKGVALAWEHKAILYQWTLDDLAARKQGGKPRQQRKSEFRELAEAAEALGHHVDLPPASVADIAKDRADVGEATCSCGKASGVQPRHQAAVWRRDHMALVAYGISFVEWRAKEDDR